MINPDDIVIESLQEDFQRLTRMTLKDARAGKLKEVRENLQYAQAIKIVLEYYMTEVDFKEFKHLWSIT